MIFRVSFQQSQKKTRHLICQTLRILFMPDSIVAKKDNREKREGNNIEVGTAAKGKVGEV